MCGWFGSRGNSSGSEFLAWQGKLGEKKKKKMRRKMKMKYKVLLKVEKQRKNLLKKKWLQLKQRQRQ